MRVIFDHVRESQPGAQNSCSVRGLVSLMITGCDAVGRRSQRHRPISLTGAGVHQPSRRELNAHAGEGRPRSERQ